SEYDVAAGAENGELDDVVGPARAAAVAVDGTLKSCCDGTDDGDEQDRDGERDGDALAGPVALGRRSAVAVRVVGHWSAPVLAVVAGGRVLYGRQPVLGLPVMLDGLRRDRLGLWLGAAEEQQDTTVRRLFPIEGHGVEGPADCFDRFDDFSCAGD